MNHHRGPPGDCRRDWRLLAFILTLFLITPSSLRAQSSGAAPRKSNKAELLLLEMTVNDLALDGIIRAERTPDGRLVLSDGTWTAARLRLPDNPVTMQDGMLAHALESAPGITYRLDRSALKLAVAASAVAFESSTQALGNRPGAQPSSTPPGAYLSYDVSATRGARGAAGYGAFAEGVVFGSMGALVSGAVVRGDDRTRDIVRTDTSWRLDFPHSMTSLVVGDAIGSGGSWSRPVRFGGVRYARDFALAPGYVTYPMPSISGSAALPSTIDVLINNKRNSSANVQSGPFELTNVPVVSGAGNLQVVVRDMLGRETVINQSFYAAPQLLAPGLSDFSYESGALRENYGTRSNDYGSLFGAGTYRRGLTEALTAEVRAEIERERVAAGFGVAALVGHLGIVGVSAGYAASAGERGGHYVASAQRTTPTGGASVSVGHFERGYRPLGSNGIEPRPKNQITAGAGMQLGYGVGAGISYTMQTTWMGERFALAGFNVGMPLPGNAYLSAYFSSELNGSGGWSGGLNLVVPLDERRTVAAGSIRDTTGKLIDTLQLAQSTPAGPGLGWRVAVSDDAARRLQGGVTFNTLYGQVTAEANAGPDASALRVGASGSIGRLQGLPFASMRIGQGAFAVVRVGDLEGVQVSLSNQVVATTNSTGMALVSGLLPYQINQLSLNPDQLPLDAEIRSVRETATPYARSGVVVDFPVRRSRNALVVLQQPDGSPVPAGARVTMTPGNTTFIVARRGEVFLLDLQPGSAIDVGWPRHHCSLSLPPIVSGSASKSAPSDTAKIGPLTCGSAR